MSRRQTGGDDSGRALRRSRQLAGGDQWDTVMNYDAFMEPLTWFLTGMEKHSDEYNGVCYGDGVSFFRSMYYHMSENANAVSPGGHESAFQP